VKFFATVATIVALMLSSAPNAKAGTLVLSADTNIVEGLSATAVVFPLIPGNQKFFENVLGSGRGVKILDSVLARGYTDTTVLNNFYNGFSGVTSTIFSGPITSTLLENTDLLIVELPDSAFTGSEVDAVSTFLSTGGTVFMLTEASGIPNHDVSLAATRENLRLLNSSMSLTGARIDGAVLFFATAANGQLLASPLTSGIESFGYIYTNGILGGTALVLDSDLTTPFISYEVMPSPVPEPISQLMWLLGLGLIGLNIRRGRQN
jgi:PEP-CTERM motif